MAEQLGALYHWSPRDRRKQIVRHGLRPSCPPTTCTEPYDAVCLSPTPSMAWALSGQTRWTDVEHWDLWQVRLADTDTVDIRGMYGNTIEEIRVHNRIPKARLWWIGERVITPKGGG